MAEKPPFTLSRRALLVSGALAGAGLAAGCLREPRGKISPQDVMCAEKLAGVGYTGAERSQMLGSLEDQLETLRAIRTLRQPNTLAPALVFDPRLKGKTYRIEGALAQPQPSPAPPFPSAKEDIAFAPLAHLSHWIQAGKISSAELTALYLERIAAYAPKLECFITITGELALRQAAAADAKLAKGEHLGPLHGVPYALKDLIDTKGIKTTWGALPFKDRVPDTDAWVVARLREAGAVLLGKTSCGAIAYGDVWYGGRTRNPWNAAEGSSGSSAGSASATAAGLCGFSIGTETLGSIISPSNRCGTAGLRPTFGRVPRTGAMALCWSLDKIGPICRAAEDTLLVLAAINGYDPLDPGSIPTAPGFSTDRKLTELTLGFDPAWFEGEDAHPLDRAAFEALKGTGVALKQIKLPERPHTGLIVILEAEAAAAFEELTEEDKDDLSAWHDADAWPNTWRRARFIPAIDVINADRLRRTVMEDMDAVFAEVDLIAGPNFAGSMLLITNYTGHPQLSVRAGFFDSPPRGQSDQAIEGPAVSVPRNFSLWGPLFGEGTLVRLGAELERRLGAWNRRPELS